jgi:cell division protein ZapA
MATVTVEVNGRAYLVGCEDGQEAHVESLARAFSGHVREVSRSVGQVGDLRLFLMAALLGADELADTRARLGQAQAELARRGGASGGTAATEARAAKALDQAAARIEDLLER